MRAGVKPLKVSMQRELWPDQKMGLAKSGYICMTKYWVAVKAKKPITKTTIHWITDARIFVNVRVFRTSAMEGFTKIINLDLKALIGMKANGALESQSITQPSTLVLLILPKKPPWPMIVRRWNILAGSLF